LSEGEYPYRLLLHPNIEKQLGRIPATQAKRLADAMRSLRKDPSPVQCKHLLQELFRIREGEYRIVYAVFDDEHIVYVGKVARRSEKVYRDLTALLAAARKSVDET
jgi:mRNA interferase RelE/StbE